MGRRVERAELEQIALDWLAGDHRPRVIVDSDRAVLWINDGARDIIHDCAGIDIRDGVIRFDNPSHGEAFNEFLGTLADEMQSLTLSLGGEGGHALFRGRRMRETGYCCLELRFSSPLYRPALTDFDRVFGLTASEARTATALFGGQTASEVAAERQVSIDTVRTHIRQVYAKMGISNREQFFRQLHPFRID